MTRTLPSMRRRRIATLVVVVVCLIAATAVVCETVSAALIKARPQWAAMWWPVDGDTRVASAEAQVNEALSSDEIAKATAEAKQAVRQSPLSAVGLRVLAQTFQLNGDEERASRLMRLAGERNLRDTSTQLWLFHESLAAKRYDDAFSRADLLLRRHAELEPSLFPQMVGALDQPAARTALLGRLRHGPNWRGDFLTSQTQTDSQAELLHWLLNSLRASPHPPTPAEAGAIAHGFVSRENWRGARDVWKLLDQKDAALLYDGDFEQPPREPPFGWQFVDSDGSVGSVETLPAGGHGLFAEFPLGRATQLAQQLLVLDPGRYRFTGRIKIEKPPAGGIFRWTITCAGARAPLLSSDFGQQMDWRRFQVDFEAPPSDCPVQWLQLSATGGEGYSPASAMFDDLKIERLP
jgi:hypothetical protein